MTIRIAARYRVFCIGLLIGFASGLPGVSSGADPASPPPGRPSPGSAVAKAMDTNAFALLTAQEMSVDSRVREITGRLIDLNRSMQESRSQVVTQDAEIKALAAEIEQKQAELEKRIAEKHPKLGAMMREREQLLREHSLLHVQVMDLRKQRQEMVAGGE